MPRQTFDDNTYFKHKKSEKVRWKKAAKSESAPDLSFWIRKTLNEEADITLAAPDESTQ